MDPREELKTLILARGLTFHAISRLLDRNGSYIQQFIERGSPRVLSERDRRRLAAFFGVDEERLGGPPASERPMYGWVQVPRYSVRAAAGAGAIGRGEAPIEHVPFDPAWLRGLGIRNLAALSLIRVEGDSMMPTLGDGDDILVDTSIEALRPRDGVFVLRMDGALLVKRLALNPAARTINILSDNEAYRDFPDCDPGELDVVGRVVWAAKAIA